MATLISMKIDVKKIEKERLYIGEKGVYLNAVIVIFDEPDEYGRNGMILQEIAKDERQAGVKATILGNVSYIPKRELTQEEVQQTLEDLPF